MSVKVKTDTHREIEIKYLLLPIEVITRGIVVVVGRCVVVGVDGAVAEMAETRTSTFKYLRDILKLTNKGYVFIDTLYVILIDIFINKC